MKRQSPRGFTVVELIFAVGLLAAVLAVALPALRAKEDDENLKACTNTLRELIRASNAYALDNKGVLPHGSNSPWVPGEMIGTSLYLQTIYKPSQFCGAGLLMASNYIPEKKQAIACPQTDRREDKGYNTNTTSPLLNFTSSEINDAAYSHLIRPLDPASEGNYYRNLVKTNQQVQLASTYGIRGPSLKPDAIAKTVGKEKILLKPAQAAWFVDYEAANQKLVKEVKNGDKKVIEAWGRVHPQGINTAYADGHVEMFADEDRTKTYAGGEICNYGTAIAIDTFDLDKK